MNLTRINTQAAMNCTSLTGLLDLSHSKVTYIGKSTFNGCTNLTGVFFPSSLKYTGDQEGGSVFKDCTDLQFVRVTSKNNIIDHLIQKSSEISLVSDFWYSKIVLPDIHFNCEVKVYVQI